MKRLIERFSSKDGREQPSTSSSSDRTGGFLRTAVGDVQRTAEAREVVKNDLPKITKIIDDAMNIARLLDQDASADHYDVKQLTILTNEAKRWSKGHQGALGLTKKDYEDIRKGYLDARRTSEKKSSDLQAKVRLKQEAVDFLNKVETRLQPWITSATEKLLNDFTEKFPESAKLIKNSPPAMELVQDAAKAGVVFGGYSEGDRATTNPADKTVYVPQKSSDHIITMRNFLFELNNGMRSSSFVDLESKARESKITAKDFAYQVIKLEVEGALRTGKIWSKMKKASENPTKLDQYDKEFYIPEYKAHYEQGMSKRDITNEKLQGVYDSGQDRGKTREAYYTEVYNRMRAAGTSTQ